MAKRQKLPLKPRKPVTWCCLPYTLTPPAKRWYVYSNGSRPLDAIIGAYAGNSPASGTQTLPALSPQQGEPIHIPDNVWPSPLPHWQAPGCVHCYHGFYGRTALFEVLPITPSYVSLFPLIPTLNRWKRTPDRRVCERFLKTAA